MKNINDYIKDLSPELQKKAQDCKNIDELLKLADENDIEIPKDALAQVSGGGACDDPAVNGPVVAPQKPKHNHLNCNSYTLDWKYNKARNMKYEKRQCLSCNSEYYIQRSTAYEYDDKYKEITKEEYDMIE